MWVGWLQVSDVAGLWEWSNRSEGREGGSLTTGIDEGVDGEKANTAARESPPAASGYPSKAAYNPPLPLSLRHTHTNIFRLNSQFLLLPCHYFSFSTSLPRLFSHIDGSLMCVRTRKLLGYTHASIHTPTQHSNVSIPVQSLCLHTHCSAEHIFTPTQWEGAEVKTTSSELRRFIFPDSLRLTGSSDL